MLPRETYLDTLDRDMRSFAEVLRTVDLDVVVPDCPGWTIRDLGRHLTEVHAWADAIVTTGDRAESAPVTEDGPALAAAYRDRAEQLLRTLRGTAPERPTWTMGPPPREASFWVRRQAHETSMHLGDALRALELEAPLDDAFAADGVDEALRMFFPRQVRLGRIEPVAHGVRVELSDVPGTAYAVAGDGTDSDAPTVATVTGSARDVLLALWHRGGIERLQVSGDGPAVLSLFATALTP